MQRITLPSVLDDAKRIFGPAGDGESWTLELVSPVPNAFKKLEEKVAEEIEKGDFTKKFSHKEKDRRVSLYESQDRTSLLVEDIEYTPSGIWRKAEVTLYGPTNGTPTVIDSLKAIYCGLKLTVQS